MLYNISYIKIFNKDLSDLMYIGNVFLKNHDTNFFVKIEIRKFRSSVIIYVKYACAEIHVNKYPFLVSEMTKLLLCLQNESIASNRQLKYGSTTGVVASRDAAGKVINFVHFKKWQH